MKTTLRFLNPLLRGLALWVATSAMAQDWPQWLGANRDGQAAAFKAPASWPQELVKQWTVAVGEGVATPALVGDRLYVFARHDGREIARCLEAGTGKELWKDEYDSLGATGPAASFSGPRSSPAVGDGKVITLGVRGVLSCLDSATGKLLWRKDDFTGAWPRFHSASSPLLAGGLVVAQLGGPNNGGVVAYDVGTGAEKWRWTGDSPAYASLALMTVDGRKLVVAETETKIVILGLADGKLLWETPFAVQGRGYNASTPIVRGQTLVYAGSGRGVTAVQLGLQGDTLAVRELWKNADNSVQFNTPVMKGELIFGLSAANDLFCLNARDGATVWTAALSAPAARAEGQSEGGQGGRRGGGRGGMGGGGGGYGSIVDAGSVLVALTPAAELVAFEPNAGGFKALARLKVAESATHAYPVLSGNRIFIKDQNSVTLWTLD
jgi:outer membrane protein assembly factor BamB